MTVASIRHLSRRLFPGDASSSSSSSPSVLRPEFGAREETRAGMRLLSAKVADTWQRIHVVLARAWDVLLELRSPFSNRRSARFFIVGSVRLMDLSSWDRIVKFNWENFSSSDTVFFPDAFFVESFRKFWFLLDGRTPVNGAKSRLQFHLHYHFFLKQ